MMFGFLFAALAMFIGVFSGWAGAGEEVMPMRGNPPDGVRPLNMVGAADSFGAEETTALFPSGKSASGDTGFPKALHPGCPEEYLRWRDNCVRTPLLVAGQSLQADHSAGFGSTPRFVEMKEREPSGFFEALLKELGTGRNGRQ